MLYVVAQRFALLSSFLIPPPRRRTFRVSAALVPQTFAAAKVQLFFHMCKSGKKKICTWDADLCKVESGKWKVESEKWKVKSGKWKVESGKCKV